MNLKLVLRTRPNPFGEPASLEPNPFYSELRPEQQPTGPDSRIALPAPRTPHVGKPPTATR